MRTYIRDRGVACAYRAWLLATVVNVESARNTRASSARETERGRRSSLRASASRHVVAFARLKGDRPERVERGVRRALRTAFLSTPAELSTALLSRLYRYLALARSLSLSVSFSFALFFPQCLFTFFLIQFKSCRSGFAPVVFSQYSLNRLSVLSN